MKVHLVTREYASDRILGRLGCTLAANTNWTLGATPNGSADLNHWLCYIEYAEDNPGWHDSLVSAYFTHYDSNEPKKSWWDIAAKAVDLRIVTAKMYLEKLSPSGKTIMVRPPVDSDVFTHQDKAKNPRPIIGVSGFVDRASGRKGEKLLGRLAHSDLGRHIELKAMGQGWPINTITSIDPDCDLPLFYRMLDVFLCTSLVEANPIPPLEALACGIPIVIPRGVGMMDDLPEMGGIYRYEKGDFDDMCQAIEKASKDQSDPQVLRDAVARYSPVAWVEGHQNAFESLMYDEPLYRPGGQRGMYCVGYGDPARDCAKGLIESFKKHMPDIPVAFAGVEGLGPEDVFLFCPDVDIGGRHGKLQVDALCPEEWTSIVYLDADIEITAPVYFLWEVLEDGWDFVICKNPTKFHWIRRMRRPDNEDECEATFEMTMTDELMQFNGGVFGFQRNPRTKAFFETWHGEWTRWGKRDQAALLRALWQQPLKTYLLTNVWNTVTAYESADITAGILHYPMKARRWGGMVHHRSDSEEAWRAVERWQREQK